MTTEVIPQTLPDSEHGLSVERAEALYDAALAFHAALHAIDDNVAYDFCRAARLEASDSIPAVAFAQELINGFFGADLEAIVNDDAR